MLHKSFVLVALTLLLGLLGCGGGAQVVRETVVVTQVVTQPAPTQPPVAQNIPTATPIPVNPTAAPPRAPSPTTAPPPSPTPTAILVNLPPFDGGMQITQIGPNDTDTNVTDALVFEAQANDSRAGGNNGDGIARMEFYIFDGHDLVYAHAETRANYCAFGGGDPDCTPLNLVQAKTWPGTNNKIHNGQYALVAKAFTPDNRAKQADAFINILLNTTTGGVQVQIVQTAPNSNSTTVQGALVFQAVAYDSGAGTSDGAGIDHIEMFVLDSRGNAVHYRKEQNSKFCAFGGGEPDCTVYKFAAHGNRWDNNAHTPIQYGGTYVLRAIAHASNGSTGTAELQITIQY